MATLSFLGAARTVTGSEYLLQSGDASLLVDCGMFQGEKELRLRNWAEPTFDVSSVKALVLTHTHLDHIGRIPRLVKQGFKGQIYCTPPTLELAEVLLKDSAHLQKEDAGYLNRKGYTKHAPALPLYDEADVEEALRLFVELPYGQEREVAPGLRFSYIDAGHILGAASVNVHLRTNGASTRLLFSGDVGRFNAVLVKDPQLASDADYVVVESTYGNRLHEEVSVLDELEAVLKRTFTRGGILVVPAFAVSRAQQIIYLLDELVSRGRVRPFPIHLDSPMAVDATRIYSRYPDYHRVNLNVIGGRSLLYGKWVQHHKTRHDSEALNQIKGPAVIISSSGMLSGGRILHHCRVRLPHPENTLLIAGFQAATTLGRALLDGAKVVRIHKQEVPVAAEVAELHGLSGHADANELLRWLSGIQRAPRCIFVTHGEEAAANALAGRIHDERGFVTHVPAMNEAVEIESGSTPSTPTTRGPAPTASPSQAASAVTATPAPRRAAAEAPRDDAPVDLRSDTVTRPTPEMRQAMADAEVGDDVYGEDPTVNRLQELAASRLAFEAALFFPSGTMANATAVRILTEPGQELLVEERSHVVRFELAGLAEISRVLPRMVRAVSGHLTADDVRAALTPPAYYKSDLGLVVLENTHNLAGGTVRSVDETAAVIAACREAKLRVHIDGARIWNAAAALGVTPAALAAGADTLMVSLSKGLAAPVGSLLLGSRERIERARRVRKLLGGGMRQAGVLAAAGIVALETMVERLVEDHENARLLGEALSGCRGVTLVPVRTNIVVATLTRQEAPTVAATLARDGILVSALDRQTLRLVTHKDVSRLGCERAASALRYVLA